MPIRRRAEPRLSRMPSRAARPAAGFGGSAARGRGGHRHRDAAGGDEPSTRTLLRPRDADHGRERPMAAATAALPRRPRSYVPSAASRRLPRTFETSDDETMLQPREPGGEQAPSRDEAAGPPAPMKPRRSPRCPREQGASPQRSARKPACIWNIAMPPVSAVRSPDLLEGRLNSAAHSGRKPQGLGEDVGGSGSRRRREQCGESSRADHRATRPRSFSRKPHQEAP